MIPPTIRTIIMLIVFGGMSIASYAQVGARHASCEAECNLLLYLLAPRILQWGVAHYVDTGRLAYPLSLDRIQPGLACQCCLDAGCGYTYQVNTDATGFTVTCPIAKESGLVQRMLTEDGLAFVGHGGQRRSVDVAHFLDIKPDFKGRFASQKLGRYQLLLVRGPVQPRVVVLNPSPLMRSLVKGSPSLGLSDEDFTKVVRLYQIKDVEVLKLLKKKE